jgi:hypothetical protein
MSWCRKFLPLLNPAPEIFHGRSEYVEATVTALLEDKASCLAILGPGGIGKSSIARTVLHDTRISKKFGYHCRFVSCEGITSCASLVDTLCTAFERQNISANRCQDLFYFLKQTYFNRDLLLILDNFETVWDVEHAMSEVEELLQAMGQVPMLSLLLTMRGSERPAGLRWTFPWLPVVKPLSPIAAFKTFLDAGGEKDEKLEELL